MRKKIGLFLNSHPGDGGAFQYSQSVLKALSSLSPERFTMLVACTKSSWIDPVSEVHLPSLYLPSGFWGFPARKRISRRLPLAFWRRWSPVFNPTIKALARQACDLWIFPAQDTWTYLCPFPALGTVYDLMHRYEKRFSEVSANGIYESREHHYKNLCRWSKGIMVDSGLGKKQLIESYNISPEKIFILPFVATTRQSIPEHDKTFPITGFCNLPEKFLFYPAQFWEHKNHQGLVRAVHKLRGEIPDLRLVFAGSEKNGYNALQQLIHRLDLDNFISFLGYVPDSVMPMLYKCARGLIMPTFFGPTNIPPLEAMAEGCPVAVSDIYGMREQLGDAAIYFNPTDISDIASAIRRIWTDDALFSELAQRGRQHHQQWNQHHFNKRLFAILEAITGEDNSHP